MGTARNFHALVVKKNDQSQVLGNVYEEIQR